MNYKDILVETGGETGIITLNSPMTINALSRNMIVELSHAFHEYKYETSVKAIIVRSTGKHFCSGHNLTEMTGCNLSSYKSIFESCSRMMQLIHDIPQIVIAQVHGVATAAGCQFVAQCDLAVGDTTARFGTPGVKIGLFCTTPMVALTRAVGRKLAMEMLMTGRLISAQEALQHGLLNKVVDESELEKATLEMANSICEASPLTLAIGKKAFYDQIDMGLHDAYQYANNVITLNLMADDAQHGISCFLQKKKPEWTGR